MSYLDPPSNFSQRFHVKNKSRRSTPEDEALEKHIHGSLYPFESQPFNNCFAVQLPSRKVKSYCRGTFSTSNGGASSDGWGFLVGSAIACSDPTPPCLYYTDASANPHDVFANRTDVTATNAPFQTAQFGSALLNVRFVSYSIRVRNITPMLYRGGTLYALKSPNDYQLSGLGFNTQIANLDTSGCSVRCDTDGREWQTLSWCPRDHDQMEYHTNPVTTSGMGGVFTNQNLAFVAQSPGPFGVGSLTQQTYEWEYVCHFEVITNNSTQQTQVHGATRGISHLQVAKANQIINDLYTQPKIIKNPASSQVAGFIADMIAAGQGAAEIVGAASDLVDRTAAIAPRVIASARALGAWL